MPKIMLTVPETDLSVTRPVVLDVTRQLLKDTGISAKTTIFYPGSHERGAQPNSLISQGDESDMFPFNERISIEVEENYNADRILSEAVYQPEHLFVFSDLKLDTIIKPVYSMADIVINIKYRAKDKTSALRWRDDMRARIGMMKDLRYHDVSYHYLVPPEFMVILQEIHRMRESVAGYGDSFNEYLKSHLANHATILTNLAGRHGQWGIPETQQRIQGYFDFAETPEQGAKEDDGDTWTTSVSYKFSYEKPIACVMMYPLMIHNQLLSEKFRPTEPLRDPAVAIPAHSRTMRALSFFEEGTKKPTVTPGIAVPHFDEMVPSSIPGKTKRVVTMLTAQDPARPGLLVTSDEMASVGIDPKVLEFMKKEFHYMTRRYQSIFQLDFYRNSKMMPQQLLKADKELNISTMEELSLRDYHHVRLSIVSDLRLLPAAAIERARHNGLALQIILEYLAPYLPAVGLIPKIIVKDTVGRKDLDAAIDTINADIISEGNGQNYQFNTVGSIFVQAFKRSN